jgi:hypothetical protein
VKFVLSLLAQMEIFWLVAAMIWRSGFGKFKQRMPLNEDF